MDQDKKKTSEISGFKPPETAGTAGNNFGNKIFYYFLLAIIVFALIFGLFYFLFLNSSGGNSQRPGSQSAGDANGTSSDPASRLPGEYDPSIGNGFSPGNTANIQAEDILFGHFYEKWRDNFSPSPKSYDLPINVKDEAANYYKVSRKHDLDPDIDSLNLYGFSIAENNYKKEADDFFSFYRLLIEKDVPLLITTDYLIYYYQNNLKQIFKEIEKNAFYDNLWDISKKMYDMALAEYRNLYEDIGLANDPVLEGSRLKLAYFAVALNLLKPGEKQIDRGVKFSDETKFTPQEAEKYYFDMPDFLRDDVSREVEIILNAGKKTFKSPVLLYERDYSEFIVPSEYSKSTKLTNFYLALKWYNSLFPLYQKDDECTGCLLDKNDWLINFIAASSISEDISRNQDIKNQWAVIYKFIAFFTGLKSDLTYLHYDEVFTEIYGNDYDIRSVFAGEQPEIVAAQILPKLEEYEFLGIIGGDSRGVQAFKPQIGMRMLQELYWPNEYIFEELTGKDMVYLGDSLDRGNNKTYCVDTELKKDQYFRCAAFGRDIINLVYGLSWQDDYFTENTNYYGYRKKIDSLQDEISSFDSFTWNSNIYWLTMDIGRSLLEYRNKPIPAYMQSEEWIRQRSQNTLLGAWANINLPADDWAAHSGQKDSHLGAFSECNPHSYIEPNYTFVQELIVKNNMLIKIINTLNISKKTNAASVQLKELNNKMLTVLEIIKKELDGQPIDKDDCRFINELAGHFALDKTAAERSFSIDFGRKKMTENISGFKILSLVYSDGDKKIIVLGPIFNYQEN